jgi:UDP-N-acetylmuramate-alanine ligase
MPGLDDAARNLRPERIEGDLMVTIGAGDVNELARRLLA